MSSAARITYIMFVSSRDFLFMLIKEKQRNFKIKPPINNNIQSKGTQARGRYKLNYYVQYRKRNLDIMR